MTRILIGSDVCPTDYDQWAFLAGDSGALLNDMQDVFNSADLRIVNLECPLVDRPSPIAKSGPALSAPSGCVRGLQAMGVDVIGLANNHILDQGPQGMINTIAQCSDAGMMTVGAGGNLAQAASWLSVAVQGLRIGIVAAAEHEWSIATDTSPGAAPVDLIEFSREMRQRREDFDFVLVILHGGNEHYPYPNPWLQNVCRFMIEQGADAVICQHTHCPGCAERYQQGHIVYGQGNMIFHSTHWGDPWHQGFLVALLADKGMPLGIELIPYQQSRGHVGAKRMTHEEEAALLSEIASRSEDVQQPQVLARKWSEFCLSRRSSYISSAFGFQANGLLNNRAFRFLNRRGRLERFFYSDQALLVLTDYLNCESHRAALIQVLDHEVRRRLS